MRPIRIELEGFMAHRQPSRIDLSEADFFSLSGPTGSGKSSLIDAMVFALYGRVPRLGAKAVAPVISSGAERARVLVEFETEDEVYIAVRSVKRTGSGATTDLARLQIGDEVVASGADAVTSEVEQVLSLGFDDFTRTVVLPQGDFAEFLEATPGERQNLLRKLLEYDFSDVRSLAKTRAAVAESRKNEAEARLDSLELPSEGTLNEVRLRKGRLEEIAQEVVDREEALAAMEKSAEAASAEVVRITHAMERLGSIRPPGNIDELTQEVTDSRNALENAEETFAAGVAALKKAESERDKLPTEDAIRGMKDRYGELEDTQLRIGRLDVDKAIAARDSATEIHATNFAELAQIRGRLDEMRTTHAAHALRKHLRAGEHCPVCSQMVSVISDSDPPKGLDSLEKEEERLSSLVADLQVKVDGARETAAAAEAARLELTALKRDVGKKLEGAPPVDSLDQILADIGKAGHLVAERQESVAETEELMKKARRSLEDASEALASLGRQLMAARESIADLEPPLPTADDPLVQWKELLAWSLGAREELGSALVDAREATEGATVLVEDAKEALKDDLEALGITVSQPYAVQVTRTLDQTTQQLETFEKTTIDAAELGKAIKTAKQEMEVAKALAAHLNVNRFEQWLMQGAVADLVEGANELLEDLSGGGYSLDTVEDGTLEIIDHRNAEENRPVSTLSGGETFLVSLALALSLAETLSSSRGAGLDAIILDEGFGTLDDESLDTVASVLEELTGRGLMVGVISHVKELARRAPVRFEVRKTPAGASVEVAS